MTIKLTHPFKLNSFDIAGLFQDTNKLSTFCTKLEKQSILHPENYIPTDYLGDGLELLIEGLIKLSPADNRIGITQYRPILQGEDSGADGVGVGIDGKPACVQMKYKSNKEWYLSNQADHLTNLGFAAYTRYGVQPESTRSLFVFTTGKGLLPSTEIHALQGKVKCFGYPELRELLDNNFGFWQSMRELVAS